MLATRNHQKPLETTEAVVKNRGFSEFHHYVGLGSYQIFFKKHRGINEYRNHQKPPETTRNHQKPLKVPVKNHGFLQIFSFCKFLQIFQFQRNSPKTSIFYRYFSWTRVVSIGFQWSLYLSRTSVFGEKMICAQSGIMLKMQKNIDF